MNDTESYPFLLSVSAKAAFRTIKVMHTDTNAIATMKISEVGEVTVRYLVAELLPER